MPWANGPAESFLVASDELRRLAESAGFAVREWLDGQQLIARIGKTASSGRRGMTTGIQGVTLSLLMPDFQARMAALARNVEQQRMAMIMAVFSRT